MRPVFRVLQLIKDHRQRRLAIAQHALTAFSWDYNPIIEFIFHVHCACLAAAPLSCAQKNKIKKNNNYVHNVYILYIRERVQRCGVRFSSSAAALNIYMSIYILSYPIKYYTHAVVITPDSINSVYIHLNIYYTCTLLVMMCI